MRIFWYLACVCLLIVFSLGVGRPTQAAEGAACQVATETEPTAIPCQGFGYYCQVTDQSTGQGLCRCSFGQLEVLSTLGILENPQQNICDFVGGQNNRPLSSVAIFIVRMLSFFIVAAGLISVVVAGYIYMTAGGDGGRITLAKTVLWSALLGIFLAMAAYVILNTISAQFVNVSEPVLVPPGQ